MKHIQHFRGLLACAMALPLCTPAAATTYKVTDLGTLGGTFSQPFVVNRAGVVGGGATLANGAQHAVLWSKSQATDLGTLGGQNSFVGGLNRDLVASGAAETATTDPNGENFCGFGTQLTCLPTVWQSGHANALPTLGGTNGVGLRNNAYGAVAGYAETASVDPSCPPPLVLQFKPVVWRDGKAKALPTVGGDLDGVAMGLNGRGAVVGASGSCAAYNGNTGLTLQPVHALLWINGKVTDLGNLGGATGAALGNIAWSVNDVGQVVGISDLAGDTTSHGFVWQNGKMTDLGTVAGDVASAAISINGAGVIAGLSIAANGNSRAAIWRNGVIQDLNTLAPKSPLYLLTSCWITESGEITGLGLTATGDVHTYLATPN